MMSGENSPRVLMLTHRLPYPPDRGDRIRSYHLLKLLSQHARVSLASLTQEDVSDKQLAVLQSLTSELAIEPVRNIPSKVRALKATLTGRAITPAIFYEKALAKTITQWQEKHPFDAVLTFCSGMVQYTRLVPSASAKHVLDLVDVDSVKWDSYAMASLPPKRWIYHHESKYLRRIEAGVYDHFDAMTVVSEREYKTYVHHVGDNPRLHVVGNGVDLDYFKPLPDAQGSKKILFVGVLDYKPNIDAVNWFAKQVMPLVLKQTPDATFEIVGRHPTPQVNELGKLPGVHVVGPVDDVREHMAQAGVVVAPLRIARGIQNKVLEAMASQRVVVCSPQAAEGVNAIDGAHFLVGHLPDQWARHLEWILGDDRRRQHMASSARMWVSQQYTWDVQLAPMLNLILNQSANQQQPRTQQAA